MLARYGSINSAKTQKLHNATGYGSSNSAKTHKKLCVILACQGTNKSAKTHKLIYVMLASYISSNSATKLRSDFKIDETVVRSGGPMQLQGVTKSQLNVILLGL